MKPHKTTAIHVLQNSHPSLYEHLPLMLIVGSYILAGYFIQYSFGFNKMMNLRFSYKLLNIFTVAFSVFFLVIQLLRGNKEKYFNFRAGFGTLIVIVLASPFMSTFASFKQIIPFMQDFVWDGRFMKLDYIVHFRNHPWEIFDPLLKHPNVIVALDRLYMLWFPILFFMCLWMAWSARRRLRLQFFVTACLVWILLGTVLATVFSSAGPCYYSEVIGSRADPYRPLLTALMNIHEATPLFSIKNQAGLWDAYQNRIWLPFGGISAMPSLHVAIAVLIAIAGWKINFTAGTLFTAYAVVIQLGSVILGWHYAVDGYFSILLTVLLWKAVEKILTLYFYPSHPGANSDD